MSLHSLYRTLIDSLHARGRDDLAAEALAGVCFTDDGTTVYVHILPKPSWPRRRSGQAFVLAFADRDQLTNLSRYRELLSDASLQLHDELDTIIRWFDGP